MTNQITYTAYADGACSGNPGPGGWGCLIKSHSGDSSPIIHRSSHFNKDTTNNRMELMGLMAIFDYFLLGAHPAGFVSLKLDSEYALKGLFEWLPGWRAKGWRTASKKPVANAEIWQMIDNKYATLLARGFTFEPHWVKGHNGDAGNEEVDQMAVEMRDLAKQLITEMPETPVFEDPLSDPSEPAPQMTFSKDQVDLMEAMAEKWRIRDLTGEELLAEVFNNLHLLKPNTL